MRSNTYARFTNPGKFMTPKSWAEEAIADGNRIREMLHGKRVLEVPAFGSFVPSTHVKPKHDRMELGE